MFHVADLDDKHVKSYATEANAVKALEKILGPKDTGDRKCNVIMARNGKARFVPILINVDRLWFGRLIHSGFLVTN